MVNFPIPSRIPTPQGQNCPTFKPPPLDGSYTVPELFDYNAEHNTEHPLFVFADGENTTRTVRYPEAWRMIKRTAKIVQGNYKRLEDRYVAQENVRPAEQGPTIGILASVDTISYFSMIVGTMRLGFVPFPISIRNSPAGVAHLISKTHVIQLYVSPDPAMQRLCKEAVTLLEKDGVHVEVLPMIQFANISDEGAPAKEEPEIEFGKLDLDKVVCVMHSSGSTSFPKPIYFSHRTLLQWTMLPSFGEVDLCGMILGVHAVPLFHAMGIVNVIWTVVSGLIMGVFKPSSPPVVPTPERYLEGIKATKSEVLFCVPSFVEAWVYSGAPMNKTVGDQLARMGVALFPFYGATEIGSFSMFIPSELPSVDEWEYFKISPNLEVEMLPQDGMDDIFEATVIHTQYFKPNVINGTTKDGRGIYRTSDLVQRHPHDPERWRMYGRTDDQLMLSTGEKTNPGPLEAILVHDPHIAAAIMFGRGRFQNGVLIEPKKEFMFDPRDERKLADFRNKIWPAVERLNQFAPAHSRLFKEMIVIADPAKPFEYTPKGTPRRHVVIKAYEPEIEAVYDAVKDSSQPDLPPPTSWTEETTLEFMRAVVAKVMKRKLGDGDDLFQEGCDSLEATWIRNTVMHALRQSTSISLHGLPANFVYDNPTIATLAAFVAKLLQRSAAGQQHGDSKAEADQFKIEELDAMVAKYTTAFPSHIVRPGAVEPASVDEVVFNYRYDREARGASPRAARCEAVGEKGKDVFKLWGLNERLVDSGKVVLLRADLPKPNLGLKEETYKEIQASVTSVIHNAWRVDFNLSLSSFEPLIMGVRNLVDLVLGSPRPAPPAILFTSSISVLANQHSPVPELPIAEAKQVVGLGYGESKWVGESVLLRAMRETGMRANVVRVGQLAGDSVVGGWNEKEWVPVFLRGSQVLKAVPKRDEEISWIPVDVAASALLEMLGSSEPVLHLVHPNPAEWGIVSDTASELLGVPVIPYADWVSKLQEAHRTTAGDHDAPKKNPALNLVDFFANDLAIESSVVLSTERAEKVSESLRNAKRLGREDVEKWIAHWRGTGFLSA
ncbi:hypothetical protein EW146_g4648 [Bondarzewia mesenterica]|uniref:Polyketide synthase-like phosphopantetheine-binding domain-containing protein n=1 Tax=Bondarzewia mesenterica TaxID=1095465 RepID=A0A4S4LUE1_9AGAM|nr:hypothetical protein EW146_g4648 [Bondarzewia mesenterica]